MTGASSSIGRSVARGTVAYVTASVAQRSIGFLLLPLYARVLSPEEYGQIGVITAVAAALGTVLGFGLETAVFRTRMGHAADLDAAELFVNTVGGFALVVPTAIALALALSVGEPAADLLDIPPFALQVSLVGTALMASATVVPLALLRAQERLRDYLRLTGVQVVFSVGITLILVVVLRLGVLGWIAATAVSSGVLLIRGLVVLRHRWRIHVDRRQLGEALAFGLPLVPHALSHWGLSLSDRAILGAFVDSAQVGVYYVGYQFTLPISLIAVAVSQGIQPIYARVSVSQAAGREASEATTHQAILVVMLAGSVAVVGPPVVDLAMPAAYAAAADFIPWLALGVGLFGLYLIPMNAVSLIAGRTKWVWAITLIAASANIALNLVLVPIFGALAAAINTAVAYAVLLLGVYLYMLRVVEDRIAYDWRRMGYGLATIGLGVVSAMMLAPPEPIVAIVLRSFVMIGVAGVLVLTGWWPIALPTAAIPLRRVTRRTDD